MTSSALPSHSIVTPNSSSGHQRRRRHGRRDFVNDRKFTGERLRELPKEKFKTIVSALLLYVSTILTSLSLSFINEVVPRDRPLNDLVFRFVPVQEWAWPMSDCLVVIMGSFCGISMLLHRYRWIVLRRIFLIAFVLYCFRCLAMVVTWMPLSDRSMINKCVLPESAIRNAQISINTDQDQPSNVGIPWSKIVLRTWYYSINWGLRNMESNRVLCGDYIYSGHTLIFVLTSLTIRTYMPRTGIYGFLRYAYPTGAVVGMVFVTISRLHYTIDVIVAYWMTTLTFWCYHLLISLPRPNSVTKSINMESLEGSKETIILIDPEIDDDDDRSDDDDERESSNTKNLIFNLYGSRIVLEYFEKNIPPGVEIPRELHWPFNSPILLCRLVNGLNEASTLSYGD